MTGEDRAETLAVAQQQGDSLHLERAGERFENLLDRLRQVPVGDMAQTRKDQLAQAQALQLVLLAVGLPVEVGDVHAQQQRASQAVERLHRLETTGQWRGGIAAQRQVETLAPAQAGQRRRTGARRSRYSAKGRGCSPSPWAHCRRYACRPPTRITRSCSSISKHRSQLLSEALQRRGLPAKRVPASRPRRTTSGKIRTCDHLTATGWHSPSASAAGWESRRCRGSSARG